MFQRFTDEARRVVVLAQEEARLRRSDSIDTEHLLLALYRAPDNRALTVLHAHGVDRAAVETAVDALRGSVGRVDAEALATLGIDLDEVRRRVEDTFGPGALDRPRRRGRWWTGGHIPFDRAAKTVLEQSLREALALDHNHIGAEHILLGLLHVEGAARTVLRDGGLSPDAARAAVAALARERRAG